MAEAGRGAATAWNRPRRRDRQRHSAAPDDPDILYAMEHLASVLTDGGELEEAEVMVRNAISLRRGGPEGKDPKNDHALIVLGRVLVKQGAGEEAERHLRECLEIQRKAWPRRSQWQIGNSMSVLGEALVIQRRFEEAEPLLVEGHAEMIADFRARPAPKREAVERLISLYERWGKPDAAAAWRAKQWERPE